MIEKVHMARLPLPSRQTRSLVSSVLTNPAFRSLWLGQICSQLAIAMLMFVLALRVYQFTTSSAAVSGLYLAFAIPALVFGMAAGAIVDHFDKRFILVLCDMLRAVLVIGFLFVSQNLFFLYLLAFISAIITQFYVPAEAPTIPRVVRAGELVTANSLFSFTYYSSLAIGSILAGPTLKFFGPYGVFILMSALFLLATYFESKLPREADKRQSVTLRQLTAVSYMARSIALAMQEGITYISKSRVLLDALLLLTGTQIILGLLATLGPGFADRMLEIDIHDVSLFLVGPVILGILLGSLWVGNMGYKLGPNRLIRWGITGAGVILILIAVVVRLERFAPLAWLFTQPVILPLVLVLFFLLGVSNSMLDVPANSILQKEAEGERRGRVYGMLTAAVGGVGILPVIISGILADAFGVGKVIFALGLLIMGYGVYRMRYNKRIIPAA